MFTALLALQLREGIMGSMNTNHPALSAHMAGRSKVLTIGVDFTAYVVTLTTGEYIVTIWTDDSKDVGIQKV